MEEDYRRVLSTGKCVLYSFNKGTLTLDLAILIYCIKYRPAFIICNKLCNRIIPDKYLVLFKLMYKIKGLSFNGPLDFYIYTFDFDLLHDIEIVITHDPDLKKKGIYYIVK